MKKAFSLTELLVGLLLSLLLSTAVISTLRVMLERQRHFRARTRIETNVGLAYEQIKLHLLDLEPDFWARFPIAPDWLPHGEPLSSALYGAAPCPSSPADDCLLTLDLEPTTTHKALYQASFSGGNTIQLQPFVASPHNAIRSGSVLLLASSSGAIAPILVATADGDHYSYATGSASPWPVPSPEQRSGPWEAAVIGKLVVRHITTKTAPNRGRELVISKPKLVNGAWRLGRRNPSYTHLSGLQLQREFGAPILVLSGNNPEETPFKARLAL